MEHIWHKWVRRLNVTKHLRGASSTPVGVTMPGRWVTSGAAPGSGCARAVIASPGSRGFSVCSRGIGGARGPRVLFVEHAAGGLGRVREPAREAAAAAVGGGSRRAGNRMSQGAHHREPRCDHGLHQRRTARACGGQCAADQRPDGKRPGRALHAHRAMPVRRVVQAMQRTGKGKLVRAESDRQRDSGKGLGARRRRGSAARIVSR